MHASALSDSLLKVVSHRSMSVLVKQSDPMDLTEDRPSSAPAESTGTHGNDMHNKNKYHLAHWRYGLILKVAQRCHNIIQMIM